MIDFYKQQAKKKLYNPKFIKMTALVFDVELQ